MCFWTPDQTKYFIALKQKDLWLPWYNLFCLFINTVFWNLSLRIMTLPVHDQTCLSHLQGNSSSNPYHAAFWALARQASSQPHVSEDATPAESKTTQPGVSEEQHWICERHRRGGIWKGLSSKVKLSMKKEKLHSIEMFCLNSYQTLNLMYIS